ncbi:DJ-1/PfpI family protein [Mycoplasmatota bacterium]|nr:DJ-1/PfpI family protein [Mycoplasmatota bacterium]
MGKILIYLYNQMADFEMTFATTTMIWLKKEVITISNENKTVKAYSGLQYQPHMTVSEALSLEDIDGLIIPGGWERELTPNLKTLIEKLNTEKKLLCAICAGPQFLANAGVLNEVQFTTTLTKESLANDNLEDFFNWDHFIREKVVRDQNIITALGNAFIDFAIEILDYFNAFEDANQKEFYRKQY